MGGYITGGRINPLSLRFYDDGLEHMLRAKAFHSSFVVYTVTMGSHIILHIILPMILPRCAMVSYVFLPVCVIAFLYRIHLVSEPDQEKAHDRCSFLWLVLVCWSFTVHRVLIGYGIQEQIEQAELLMYMLSIALEIIVMHLQHFDFTYRTIMNAVILMHTGSPGWNTGWFVNKGHALSVMGQPHDLVTVITTALMANFVGHSVESMLRHAFLERVDNMDTLQGVELSVSVDAHSNSYEVLGLLGRGGSSDVFLVQDTRGSGDGGKNVYALKRINKARLRPNQLAQIAEECAILSTVHHPYIVDLKEAFQTDSGFYYAMTYAAGGDLSCFMIKPLPLPVSLVVFAEILSALGYLHTLRIVYRDVKPENTLIDIDGHILLADFGVSKRISTTNPGGAHTMVGTYAYMSPEQMRGENYGCFVDFWGAAVLLHELLTGELPGNLDADLITAGAAAEPVGLSPMLSAPAVDLIGRMLVHDREFRLGASEGLGEIITHDLLAPIDQDAIARRALPGPLAGEVQMPRLTQELGRRTLAPEPRKNVAPRPRTWLSSSSVEPANVVRRARAGTGEVNEGRRQNTRLHGKRRPHTSPGNHRVAGI